MKMEYTTLGRTGLKVSVAGLGCGGFSRLGQRRGMSEAASVGLVREAMDLGINFIDTAAAYRTEGIVGQALKGRDRDRVVLSTKAGVREGDSVRPAGEVVAEMERSLRLLGVECIDVFHLHGVPPWAYEEVLQEVVPALLREREKGKFRFLGITEVPPVDPDHETLEQAVRADCFDVVMVAFHMMHQLARDLIFPHTIRKGIGVLVMFAVRVLFSEPGRLQRVVGELAAEGRLPGRMAEEPVPLGFLLHEGGARTVIDAAYRYCRHEPGTDVILFGTGNADHLRSNVESILSPPLPEADVERIHALFGALRGVGLDAPGRGRG